MSKENSELVHYRAPRLPDAGAIRAALESVQSSGVWNRGPIADRFEHAFAARAGAGEAVLCASATAALTLLLRADAPSGAILLPALQFPPVLAALRDSGHPATFADVDPEFWTARPVTPTRAGGVSGSFPDDVAGFAGAPSFGETASCEQGEEWSARTGKPVWFDSCHAFGSRLAGRASGSFGRAEVFSLTPSKLVIGGEGGVVTTGDRALAEELRSLRDYGKRADGTFDPRGASARAGEWTAALALASLDLLTDEIARRKRILTVYREELAGVDGVVLQALDDRQESNGQECVLRIDAARFGLTRDELRAALLAEGIEAIATYLKCLPGTPGEFPVAGALERELLHMPIGINVDEPAARRISRIIAECAGQKRRTGPVS